MKTNSIGVKQFFIENNFSYTENVSSKNKTKIIFFFGKILFVDFCHLRFYRFFFGTNLEVDVHIVPSGDITYQ